MSETDSIDPVEFTKSLISCPSVTPNEEGVFKELQKNLEKIGFTCTQYLFDEKETDPVNNLFASYGSGFPHLCFGGHTDVVPVGNINSWTNNPFEPIT